MIVESERKNRKALRLKHYSYDSSGAYFVTICTQNRVPMLSEIVGTGVLDCPRVELTKYGIIADKYIRQLNEFYNNITVTRYVIMPNHVHLLLRVRQGGQSRTPVPTGANSIVSRFVSTFKRFCNKEYGENIWQARFYDHILRDRAEYEAYTKYIYENPLSWYQDELYSK